MHYKNKIYKYGFTVAELLVVIAILSALAAVAMYSAGGFRDKGTNSKRVAIVEQYATALETYRQNNNGYYPDLPGLATAVCLGGGSSVTCGLDGTVLGDVSFNDKIKQYLSDSQRFPGLKFLNPTSQNTSWDGAVYSCVSSIPSGCIKYSITWFMQGPGSPSCGIGKVSSNLLSDDTKCLYTSMSFK